MAVEDKEILYRYRPYNENTLSEIVSNQLWHSHVRLLNDPFELPFQFDWDGVNERNLVKINRRIRLFSEPDLQARYVKGMQQESLELIKNLYQDQVSQLEEFSTRAFVCCFSKSEREPLMWSHYGQGMTGLCIAYNKSKLATQDRKLELKDVRYNSKVEKLTYLDINSWVDRQQPDFDVWGEKGHLVNVKMSLSALTHVYQKHKRWEYEGEVRSVLFAENDAENEKSGLLETMSNNAIEHVTIGSKMSSTNRKVILSLCKELGLPVYVASPNRYDYSVQIEYKDLNV